MDQVKETLLLAIEDQSYTHIFYTITKYVIAVVLISEYIFKLQQNQMIT